MTVCGVIAEYDPFHRGHERHLRLAREATGADYVIAVMSGSFTQRGMPALLPAHARAEMALRCGADAVLQLPYAFSVREAEYFALGGVYILHRLGCVTHLSFGCETEQIDVLKQAADLLEAPDEAFDRAVQAHLAAGQSFAAAQGRAVAQRLGIPPQTLNAPNTALALCYLRALIRLGSGIIPVPILRQADYRATQLEALPSATAVRGAILRGDWQGVARAVPENALPTLRNAVFAGLCPPDRVDLPLRQALLLARPEAVAAWPGVGEGLEMRILKAAETAVSREELIAQIKSRRYTYGRISRALCHGLMGVTKDDLPSLPASARILGFRESARPLLRRMRENGFPLYSRPARQPDAALDARADDLWRVLAGQPRGDTYRRSPVILP
ncbi:MAG: nucleotidyltransferase family protein [Clostridia bacterium]|nr:nucleotidyltransferase family protein [Clostridia bacterium]